MPDNILQNDDFEAGFSPWSGRVNASIGLVTQGDVFWVWNSANQVCPAGHSGVKMVHGQYQGSVVSMYQTITLVVGHTYRLSFWAAMVTWGYWDAAGYITFDEEQIYSFSYAKIPADSWGGAEWRYYTVDFVAQAASGVLEFFLTSMPRETLLDDITLYDVTPAETGGGAGAAGVGAGADSAARATSGSRARVGNVGYRSADAQGTGEAAAPVPAVSASVPAPQLMRAPGISAWTGQRVPVRPTRGRWR